MPWFEDRENVINLPNGETLSFEAGVSIEEAASRLMHGETERISGFFPSFYSTIERMKGAARAAPDITYGALFDDQAAIDIGRKKYEEAGRAAAKELPDPASLDSLKEAWDKGVGEFVPEAWTFAKESLGQTTPYMAPALVAGKIGASDLAAKSRLGSGVASVLSKVVPALRVAGSAAPHPLVKAGLGAAAGMGTLALQFYADNLQRQVEAGAITPEEIEPGLAALSAVPQAGLEYLFVALMGGIGRGPQRAASQAIRDSLAVGASSSGKRSMGAAGRTALESLTEFPTELGQTVLERAQAGESISLEDADFVKEMWETVAGTVPVVGVFGSAGSYRAHRAEKASNRDWEAKSEEEQRSRVSFANRREENSRREVERLNRIEDENVARFNRERDLAIRNNDGVKQQALEAAEAVEVTIDDVVEAADSRNILIDSDGFAAFVYDQTGGRVSRLEDATPAERRRMRSVLSGMRVHEFADDEVGVEMPMFTNAQFNEVVKKTRKSANITQSSVRKILGMGNSKIEKNIARDIIKKMGDRGYASRSGKGKSRPLKPVDTGFDEIQYDEVLRNAQERGRVTQESVEQVTGNYGEEYYRSFIGEMRSRGDLPGQDVTKGVYIPITLAERRDDGQISYVGNTSVEVELSRGYFITDPESGDVVGGSTNRKRALAEARRLRHRSKTYSITRNGQVVKTFKNSSHASYVMNRMKSEDPDSVWNRVSNAPVGFKVAKDKASGHRVVERFHRYGEEGDGSGGKQVGLDELSFAPSSDLAEAVKQKRLDDLTPGTSDHEIRTDKHREESERILRDFYEGRGVMFTPPERTAREQPLSAREVEVLGAVDEALRGAGLGEDVLAKVLPRIAEGKIEAEGMFDPTFGGPKSIGEIVIALSAIADAKTPAEVRARVAEIMNHEMVHAMRALDLFTENEWAALENATARVKVPQSMIDKHESLVEGDTFLDFSEKVYTGVPGYENRVDIVEEAVAEMYREFHSSAEVRQQLTGTPRSLIERMQRFLEKLYNQFSGMGFADAGNVLLGMDVVQGRERGVVRTLQDVRRQEAKDTAARAEGRRTLREILRETRKGKPKEEGEEAAPDETAKLSLAPTPRDTETFRFEDDFEEGVIHESVVPSEAALGRAELDAVITNPGPRESDRLKADGFIPTEDLGGSLEAVNGALHAHGDTWMEAASHSSEAMYWGVSTEGNPVKVRVASHDVVYGNEPTVAVTFGGQDSDIQIPEGSLFSPEKVADLAVQKAKRLSAKLAADDYPAPTPRAEGIPDTPLTPGPSPGGTGAFGNFQPPGVGAKFSLSAPGGFASGFIKNPERFIPSVEELHFIANVGTSQTISLDDAKRYHEVLMDALDGKFLDETSPTARTGAGAGKIFGLNSRKVEKITVPQEDQQLSRIFSPGAAEALIRSLSDLGVFVRGEGTSATRQNFLARMYGRKVLDNLKGGSETVHISLENVISPKYPPNEFSGPGHGHGFPTLAIAETVRAALFYEVFRKSMGTRNYRLYRGGNIETLIDSLKLEVPSTFGTWEEDSGVPRLGDPEFVEEIASNAVGKSIDIGGLAEFSASPFVAGSFAEGVVYLIEPENVLSVVDTGGSFPHEMGEFVSGSFVVTDHEYIASREISLDRDPSTLSSFVKDWFETNHAEQVTSIGDMGGIFAYNDLGEIIDTGNALDKLDSGKGITSPYYESPLSWLKQPLHVVHLKQQSADPVSPLISVKPDRTMEERIYPNYASTARFSIVDTGKSGWSPVSGQMGGNEGATYQNEETGERWYVKVAHDPEVSRNEVLAARLYEAAGVSVPEVALGVMDGRHGVASRIIDGLGVDREALIAGEVEGVAEGFAADAWLGNWDVVGLEYDNLLVSEGRAFRIDTGGALRYRAQGGLKNDLYDGAWGPDVSELESLRGLDPNVENSEAASVFKNISEAEIVSGIDKILAIPSEQIRNIVNEFGPIDIDERSILIDTLEARRRSLAEKREDMAGDGADPGFYSALEWRNKGSQGVGDSLNETWAVSAFPVGGALEKVSQTTNAAGKERDRKIVFATGNFAIDRKNPFDPNVTYPPQWGDIDPEARSAYGVVVLDKSGEIVLREVANHFDGYHWTFAKGLMNTGETPLTTSIRELQEETGIGIDTPGFRILGALPGKYSSGYSDTYFFVAEIDGPFPNARPDWVDPGADGDFAMKLLENPQDPVPRINTKAPSSQDARPLLRENPDLTDRSRRIARGELAPRKLSLTEEGRVELDKRREKGTRGYQDVKASLSPGFQNKTLWDHILSVLTLDGIKEMTSWFRQKYIDKYEGVRRVVEKAQAIRAMKGDDRFLLADLNALSAAYLSDRAVGVVEQAITSGSLVYKDGIARVDTTKKGLLEILTALFREDGDLIRDWHVWKISKRENRFSTEGRATQTTSVEREEINRFVREEGLLELFESVEAEYNEWNNAVVDFMIDTEVIDERMGEVYKMHHDYIPFFREFEDVATEDVAKAMQEFIGSEIQLLEEKGSFPISSSDERMHGPKSMFGSLTGAKPGKRAKGGEGMTVDPLTGMLKNLQAAVTSGMKNVAGDRVMRDAVTVDMAIQVFNTFEEFRKNRLDTWDADSQVFNEIENRPDEKQLQKEWKKHQRDYGKSGWTHDVRRNGRDEHFIVFDALLHDSLSGMLDGKIKYLNFFAGPATFLREMVTRSPDFIIANLLRDSVSAWTTSGANYVPFWDTFKNFGAGGITGGKGVDSYEALSSAGVIGGYDFGRDIKDFRVSFDKRLRKEGLTPGKKGGFRNMATKIWDAAGDVTTKSDAATRMAVYNDVLATTLSRGATVGQAQAEAIFQSLEVMNFSRRGNSTLAKIVTSVIPFMNARVQGLDLLYRAGRGQYASDATKVARKRAMIGFLSRGGLITTATLMYSAMAHDSDEWKDASPEERDDNWILYGLKIPIPFEVGVIFKLIPERIIRQMDGEQSSRQTSLSLKRALVNTFQFNLFGPQVVKPALEVMMNHSFFTGREITPTYLGEGKRLAFERVRPTTNQLAVLISEASAPMLDVSALEVEHLLKGYTGTLGTYTMEAMDWILRELPGNVARPSRKFEEYAFVRRFFEEAGSSQGAKSEWYQMTSEVKEIVHSAMNRFKVGDVERGMELYKKHPGAFQAYQVIKDVDKKLNDFRNLRTQIILLPEDLMDAREKRETVDKISAAEKQLLSQRNKIRDMADIPWYGAN